MSTINIKEAVEAIVNSVSCCKELKEASNNWLNATPENKAAAADALVAELKEDVLPVEQVIAFSGSEAGKKFFGEEVAAKFHAHMVKIQARGEKFCDCPACAAGLKVLNNKELLY